MDLSDGQPHELTVVGPGRYNTAALNWHDNFGRLFDTYTLTIIDKLVFSTITIVLKGGVQIGIDEQTLALLDWAGDIKTVLETDIRQFDPDARGSLDDAAKLTTLVLKRATEYLVDPAHPERLKTVVRRLKGQSPSGPEGKAISAMRQKLNTGLGVFNKILSYTNLANAGWNLGGVAMSYSRGSECATYSIKLTSVGEPEVPDAASAPNPADDAIDVSITPDLDWANAARATSYDVYFGTDSTPDSGEFQGNKATSSWSVGTLSYSTTYYWQIIAKNSAGSTAGPVWSFTTQAQSVQPPDAPSTPSPASGATNVLVTADLDWANAARATSYDVYFGTDATPDSGEFQGNTATSSWSLGTPSHSTTYYWQVIAWNSAGSTPGPVWSFTVCAGGGTDPQYFNGNYYEVVEARVTWQAANDGAAARTFQGSPGHLVTITSAAENDFVRQMLVYATNQTYWVGGFQPSGSPEPAGGWQWVTGEPWDYTNWNPPREPNNTFGIENVVMMYGSGAAAGYWNDAVASDVSAYVVEYE